MKKITPKHAYNHKGILTPLSLAIKQDNYFLDSGLKEELQFCNGLKNIRHFKSKPNRTWQDIKPNIVHRSPPAAYPKSSTPGEPNNFPPASPAYDPPTYPAEFFAKSVERPSPAGQHKDTNGGNENAENKGKG